MKETEEGKVVVGKVVRHGTAIAVPADMTLEDAARVIDMQITLEEQQTARMLDFDAHPYDVAYAFGKAIEEVVGVVVGKATFWDGPPKTISVETAPGHFVHVPWGKMKFPHDPEDGVLTATWTRSDNGAIVGRVLGEFKNKYLHVWDDLIAATKRILVNESMFKGRALRVAFGSEIASVKPWDISGVDVKQIVFSAELEQQIEDSIFTPLRHRQAVESAGTPFKRGVLLAGPYGTGKTILAAAAAKVAIENGITVLYIEDAKQLPQVIRMASQLAPALVFAEDIDRVTDGDRDHEIDLILNTLDGVDTKNFPVMTILTSNYPDKIYKGMVRPGRIDVALEIGPPDSSAAARLVKTYLGDAFDDKNGDLEEVGNALAGMIPAVIREVCERSKLSYISRTHKAPAHHSITADDVLRASGSMKNQLALLNKEPEAQTTLDTVKEIAGTIAGLVNIANNSEVREFVENNY